jgi:hypothetical protein
VNSGWRDGPGDLGGIGVTEVDADAKCNRGDEQADVGEDGFGNGRMFRVHAEGEHDDDATGTGGDGEGEGIEGLLLKAAELCPGDGRSSGVGGVSLVLAGAAVLLVQERPADHGDDDSAGDLHDGQRDAEESEKCGADELDNSEEDDGIDGDSAGEGVEGVDGSVSDEAEEDERGTERIDERKQRAEAQSKIFPDKIHGYRRVDGFDELDVKVIFGKVLPSMRPELKSLYRIHLCGVIRNHVFRYSLAACG